MPHLVDRVLAQWRPMDCHRCLALREGIETILDRPGAMPNFGEMRAITGQTVEMDSMSHMKRLVERKQLG